MMLSFYMRVADSIYTIKRINLIELIGLLVGVVIY